MTDEEWLAERKSGIGGSDAPAVLGMSKYKRPIDIYLEKRGEIPAFLDEEESREQKWGKLLEPAIRQEYAERTGEIVRLPKDRIIRHPSMPFMLCTPDGITDSRCLLEVKTARTAEGWGEIGSADIPEAYLIQVQHSLLVTALSRADVAVLIGGQDFRIYEVPEDKELQELIVEQENQFWTGVEKGVPPDPVTVEDMKRRYRSSRPVPIVANAEVLQSIEILKTIRAKLSELEGEEEIVRALIMGFIGDHQTLASLDGEILATWKPTKPAQRVDAERLRKERPEIFAEFSKLGEPFRRFLLK